MIRWNGWGKVDFTYDLPESAVNYIASIIGVPEVVTDMDLDILIASVPESRLLENDLYTIDPKARVLHSTGQSFPDWVSMRFGSIERFPDAVAFPKTNEDVQQLLLYAKEHDVVLIPYGGGSSVVGHLTIPEIDKPVVTVSMVLMNQLLLLNETELTATFQAGVFGPEIEKILNNKGYTLGHYPQSFEYSSLGGWVASRSSGQFSLNYGRIEKLFAGGKLETLNGTLEMPVIPASAAGPDIKEMVLGSEGRIGIITECVVNISKLPEAQQFRGAFFPNADTAIAAVKDLARSKIPLTMVRLSFAKEAETMLELNGKHFSVDVMDAYLSAKGIHDGRCMMLYGAIGDSSLVKSNIKRAKQIIKENKGADIGTYPGNKWYEKRFKLPYLRNTLWEMGYGIDTLETAVTWDKVPQMVIEVEGAIEDAMKVQGEPVHVFTHLSHIYPQGSSVYTTYIFKLSENMKDNLTKWKATKTAASQAIVKLGGTISHQHGVGLDHKDYLLSEKGSLGIEMMSAVFDKFDPRELLNPGKLL